ncbi:MAG: hypothetical protein HFE77_05755 [Clostridiales bacterium]|nr:hypothetical protein [Clostridiales bacterium]
MKTVRSFLVALSLVMTTPLLCIHTEALDGSANQMSDASASGWVQEIASYTAKESLSDGMAQDRVQENNAANAQIVQELVPEAVAVEYENDSLAVSEVNEGAIDSQEQAPVNTETALMEAQNEIDEGENTLVINKKTAEMTTLLGDSQEKHTHQYMVMAPGQVQCATCQESEYVSTFMPDPDAVIFSCKAGTTFWVPVLVNNTELVGITLRVDVSDNINLTGAAVEGTLFADYSVTADRNVVLNAGDRKEGNIIQNGRLVYLRFTASEDLSADDTVQIRLFSDDVVCSLGDNNIKNIEGSCHFGTVLYTVQNSLGDVNGDGIIDIEDARILHRYVEKWAPSYYEKYNATIASNGDVNGDGVIDEEDVRRLSCYVNGWEDSFWGNPALPQ